MRDVQEPNPPRHPGQDAATDPGANSHRPWRKKTNPDCRGKHGFRRS
jgi:hypothetical protein